METCTNSCENINHKLLCLQKRIVGDGERPEDIATRLYRNPFYNWTILVINDITDVYAQWPRSVNNYKILLIKNMIIHSN